MKYTIEKHDEIIKNSHKRSLEYGIEKERINSRKILKGEEISFNMKKNKTLIKVAAPFINNLYEILKGSGFLIILTDKEGCILNIIGDTDAVYAAEELNMVIGAYMDEESIGTNAMGTAINEDLPIQISAKEHFINAYHRWTCSAAPIHNVEGKIIGTINLTGHSDKVHSHTLGLAVAAVLSIENQIQAEKFQKKLMESYLYMNTIMDSISYGILAVNTKGIIKNCNFTACRMVKLEKEKLLEQQICNMLTKWDEIFKCLKIGKKYEDEQVVLKNIGKFSLSVNPINDNEGKFIGAVLVINEIQSVLNLINKYTMMRARYTFEDLIYECGSMKKIVDYAKNIADSPSTVLIQGESGTGKEVLAQAIHNYSTRNENAFVAINCGAIPKNLIESELFGYEEGAFTGAKKGGRPGKFELANGGTLFLDEIGEMPLDMQVNLLRVLQEGYITRVGGNKVVPVDVRIIAATNKNLKKEIKKGTFREDLYYRIIVIPITLPPLRERKEDIKPIMRHFLRIKAGKLNKSIPDISEEFYNKILNYDWNGNVRELENFVENVVNFNGRTTFEICNKSEVSEREFTGNDLCEEEIDKIYVDNLEELEKKAIVASLKYCEGNISKTAKTLGISRNTLYLKMKKFNINNER